MALTPHSGQERRSAWRVTALGVSVGVVLLAMLLLSGGFPYGGYVLQSVMFGRGDIPPSRLREADLIRSIVVAAIIACGSIALYGPVLWIEDAEARAHRAGADSGSLAMARLAALLGVIILVGVLVSLYIAGRALYFLIV